MRKQILAALEKDSKLDVKDLAAMLGLEETDVVNEIAAMEEEGIICGYYTLIDWDKVTEDKVTALIEVKVTPQRGMGFDSIAERIYNYDEVHALYLISGDFDFMVILEGKTMKDVALFVSSKLSPLDSILSTATHFVLQTYKDQGTILEPTSTDERMLVTL